ncbi:MAG: HD-GYP domain-containing protein [Acetatifactor sp.]
MKSVARMALRPGMVLGADVEFQGNVLFPAGTVLNDNSIERLKRFSIMCVTVKEDIDFATTHYEKLRFSEKFKNFEKKHNYNLECYKQLMLAFEASGLEIPDETLLSIYNDMRSTYESGSLLLDYLYNLMPNPDELTYNHCLNSALLAGIFAEWVCMPEDERNNLILSCFYYDIGKIKLPYEILWKSGKLTEDEFNIVKKHPVIGYSMLNQCKHIDQHIKNAVIMHHERMDGSGYPFHMQGTKIDILARYIAIIDTYIAMASPRSYRNAFTPLQILSNYESNMDKYDTSLLLPLMKRIADAQIGTNVQLSDESVWEVFIINPAKLSRPILKNDDAQILDLAQNPQLEILKIL